MRPPRLLRLLRPLSPMRFLMPGKSLSTCCACCLLFSEAKEAVDVVVVVVPFIFRILVHYETFFTRAQGPVIVIAKEEI